jgi:superfamily II DNA helicase RecQ
MNSLINVGTGQGKTLCGILPHLLLPDSVSVIVSPLKRLMVSQVKEYEDWGIHAVAINEDTSRQKGFWDISRRPSFYGISY